MFKGNITTIVLLSLIVVQQALWYLERKDLYNRIMAKDYDEYKTAGKEYIKPVSAHKRVLKKWRKVEDE